MINLELYYTVTQNIISIISRITLLILTYIYNLGNEDAGQISAWYVMASMGLYQVCPGCGGHSEYVLIAPMFQNMILNLDSTSKTFEIMTSTDDGSNHMDIETMMYIQQTYLNGVYYDCSFIAHADIINGGTLQFIVGRSPNASWARSGRRCLDNGN